MRVKAYQKSFEDTKWIIENYTELTKKYDNKFIAVQDKKVIASSEDALRLLKELRKMDIDFSTVVIDFITSKWLSWGDEE